MTTLNLLFGASGLALTAEVYYLHGPLLGTAVAAFYLACALLGYRLRHRSNPKKGLTMSWISKNVTGDPKAVADYKAARNDLHELGRKENAAGVRDETDEYHAANNRVIDAEKNIPWVRRK